MIHEIFPHHLDNHYKANKFINPDDLIFIFKENYVLLKTIADEVRVPLISDMPFEVLPVQLTFLFTLNAKSCYLFTDVTEISGKNLIYKEISFFRTTTDREVAWSALVAFHLYKWYSEHVFCGKCGSKTKHKEDERAVFCPDCNHIEFPKISPAVIVAIINGNKILLARNAGFKGDWYSLIAGYVDVGETLEEAVIREVKEEVGLDVYNLRYYKSQPWALSGSLMVGFVAEADDSQSVIVDGKEITTAEWFSINNLPNHPSSAISIAGEMIEKFEKGEKI